LHKFNEQLFWINTVVKKPGGRVVPSAKTLDLKKFEEYVFPASWARDPALSRSNSTLAKSVGGVGGTAAIGNSLGRCLVPVLMPECNRRPFNAALS
jgi:hypothetical protein